LAFTSPRGNANSVLRENKAICFIPTPKIHRQIREFSGAAGFCRIWLSNYCFIAKSLYEATGGGRGEWETLIWKRKQEKSFKEIKRALTNASAPGLPDEVKAFFLYVHERLGQLL
jgi:hypothetical protein